MSDQLNAVTAAKALGVTTSDIREWCENGMPFINHGVNQRNRYVLADIFKWHQDKVKSGAEIDMPVSEAKRRREVALALKAEVDLALARGQLVVIDDLMAEFVDSLVQVRASLIGQASRLSGLLSHQDDDTITKIINDDVEQILEALSKYTHDYRGQHETSNTGS